MNGTGLDGVVDIRPFMMDSSYDPTKEPKSSEVIVPTDDIRLARVRGTPKPRDVPSRAV